MREGVIAVDTGVTGVVPGGLLQEVLMGTNQFTTNSLTGHEIPAVCGVYQITDTITGKTYVGSSRNIRTRAIQHFCGLNSTRARRTAYAVFSATYAQYGSSAFSIDVLEVCAPDELRDKELVWIAKLTPTENTQHSPLVEIAYSAEERAMRSKRTSKLWATPEYRQRAVSARKGKAYNKGYKCTPEQVENRKRAGRISNMKRNYGAAWKDEYVRRYPEHKEDLNA
jgi:group I intron endonuclease